MKNLKSLKQILLLLTGGLLVLETFAADAPDRPLHVLCYLGPVSTGGGGGGFGGSRTHYVYLPSQTLAPHPEFPRLNIDAVSPEGSRRHYHARSAQN